MVGTKQFPINMGLLRKYLAMTRLFNFNIYNCEFTNLIRILICNNS
jgi:hypothetical protein